MHPLFALRVKQPMHVLGIIFELQSIIDGNPLGWTVQKHIQIVNSPLKKLVFPDRFAKGAIVPLRVSCAISR